MKIKSKIVGLCCVIVILILVFGKMDLYHYYPGHSYGLDSYSMTEENVSDSLDNEIRAVQQRLDSIKREKRNYIDGFEGFNGSYDNFLGLINLEQKSEVNKTEEGSTYLILSKIGLKIQSFVGDDYLAFYTKNGEGYLSRTKLSIRGKDNSVTYVDQKVDYRYSSEQNSVLLPIRSSFWKFSVQIWSWLIIIFALVSYWFVLREFFLLLIAISKNNIFVKENIKRLKKMAIILLILGVYNIIINMIIYLIFSVNHPTEGIIITYSFWEHDYFMVILSATSYLIYTAFKKGSSLQLEQDLTI